MIVSSDMTFGGKGELSSFSNASPLSMVECSTAD